MNLKITFSSPDKSSAIILKKQKKELLANSNIRNGENGFIFEDTQGNLWALGSGTKLQVLKKGASFWIDDLTQGLTKGSNIRNGENGFLFEDDQGNLWAMAVNTKLQVLKKVGAGYASSWTDDLTKGSKIVFGDSGFIFQDDWGNLWALGYNTKLQVLKKVGANYADSWTDDLTKGLTKGSKMVFGGPGFIFQDQDGNLWALGKKTKLQVLKKTAKGYADSWTDDENQEPLLKGSNIRDGDSGFIFQDQDGNLWAMGNDTKLQVLSKDSDSWES